jgi:hypothetical protein
VDAESISELKQLETLMDLGIVEDKNAERAGVGGALGKLQRVSNGKRGRE